jgi:hypothetical protein
MLKLFFKATEDSVAEIICDTLHLKVAAYFCESVKDHSNANTTHFTTSYGSKDITKDVFQWMAACCTGSGLVKFMPGATVERLVNYLELAKLLGIPILVKQLDERIRASIEAQLHVADLQFIFTSLPTNHIYRQLTVEVISYAIDNNKVRDWAGLHKLRAENKAYRDDIKAFRDMVHAPERKAKKEAWLKEKAARHAAWQAQHEQNEKEKAECLARNAARRREREERRGVARALPASRLQDVSGRWLKIVAHDPSPSTTTTSIPAPSIRPT